MALSFNCGQYEQGFDSRRLQNWELRNRHRRRPLTKSGFTQIISNDRGHLLPSQPRPARSPWGTFVGTWDLPKKLPGNKQTDPTARSAQAHMRCTGEKAEADEVIYGKTKMRRAKAGQPLQAMPHFTSDPEQHIPSGGRSGAENHIIKGTPQQRFSPVTRLSPNIAAAHPPLDMSNTNQNAPIQEQIDSELLAPGPAPLRPLSGHSLPKTPQACTPLPPISSCQ
ncbi:protein Flattop homolog [Watersipora subatra]|uniref:protein Flattop homolog n=1 Tax=Watersipora subatra TaxID=2589382 RepID=UPI00355B3E57